MPTEEAMYRPAQAISPKAVSARVETIDLMAWVVSNQWIFLSRCGSCGQALIRLRVSLRLPPDERVLRVFAAGFRLLTVREAADINWDLKANEIFFAPTERHLARLQRDLEIVRKGPTASSRGEVRSAHARLRHGEFSRFERVKEDFPDGGGRVDLKYSDVNDYPVPAGVSVLIKCPSCRNCICRLDPDQVLTALNVVDDVE